MFRFGNQERYRVGLTAQEQKQRLATVRRWLPSALRTVPVGLVLAWLTFHMLMRWEVTITPRLQILWLVALFGPFFWLMCYLATAFSRYEVVFLEHHLLRKSFEPLRVHWRTPVRAELQKFSDQSGAELWLFDARRTPTVIYLSCQTNWMAVEQLLREKLGARFMGVREVVRDNTRYVEI